MELCCRSGAEKRGRYKKLHRKREAGRGYAAEFEALEKSAQLGRKYLDSLRAEVLRLCLVCDEKCTGARKSVQLMEEPELIKLKDAFEEASASSIRP